MRASSRMRPSASGAVLYDAPFSVISIGSFPVSRAMRTRMS